MLHLIDNGIIQDAVSFTLHVEALQVLLFNREDGQFFAVMDEPFQIRLSGQLLIVIGQSQQKGRQILCAQSCQFDCAFGDLDAFPHHQISGFATGTHAPLPPFSFCFVHIL